MEYLFLRGIKTGTDRTRKQMEAIDHICSGSVSLGHNQAMKGVADSERKERHLAMAEEQWEALPVLKCIEVNTLRIP